jgi:hypothetical protein
MEDHTTIETQIQAQNSQLLDLLNKTFKLPQESTFSTKFCNYISDQLDHTPDSKYTEIQSVTNLSKPELIKLLLSLIEEKPPPGVIIYKISLPSPSLFTRKELEEMNLK